MSIKAWQRADADSGTIFQVGSCNTGIPLLWSPLNLTTKNKLALSSKDRNPCALDHTPCTSPVGYDWLDHENRSNSAHPPTSRPCSPPVPHPLLSPASPSLSLRHNSLSCIVQCCITHLPRRLRRVPYRHLGRHTWARWVQQHFQMLLSSWLCQECPNHPHGPLLERPRALTLRLRRCSARGKL